MKLEIEIPDAHIAHALEGAGSAYWATASVLRPPDWKRLPKGEDPFGWALLLSGSLSVIERLSEPEATYILTKRHLVKGLQLMATHTPLQFRLLLGGTGDANTGDCLLQFVALGELRYA